MGIFMQWWGLISVAAALTVAVAAAGYFIASRYEKVGPNEVLIVSGRRGTYTDPSSGKRVEKNFRIYHGGGTFILPVREKVNKMSVELMTLEIKTPEFYTKFGVPIVVDCIAQIKVLSDDPIATLTAAEMFLSKTQDEMNEIAHQMMQGHLRAVISTLPFEEIHANPEVFAQNVQKLTAEDLANMGIQVVSFTIREIQDPSSYLKALGRPKVAEVQKNAVLGEAKATRDASMGRAVAERETAVAGAKANEESQLARINADLAIANSEMEKEKALNAMREQVAETKAKSDLAYDLQKVKVRQLLMDEEMGVSKIERQKQIEVEELEVARKETELTATVRKPAEAEQYRIERLAAAERERLRTLAQAKAEATRLEGMAAAEVIKARGEAEAEAIRLKALAEAEGQKARIMAEAEGMMHKAKAWQQYNSAALSQIYIDKLPAIAAAVASPLAQVDRIVMINHADGGSGVERLTQGVTEVMAQLPGVVESLTGVDLSKLISQAGQAKIPSPPKPELAQAKPEAMPVKTEPAPPKTPARSQ